MLSAKKNMLNNLKNTYFVNLDDAATVAVGGVRSSRRYSLIVVVAVVGMIFFFAAATAAVEALAVGIVVVTTPCSDCIPLPPTLPGLTMKKWIPSRGRRRCFVSVLSLTLARL